MPAEHETNAAEAPVISVCVLTFNHARYIREALDSVVGQRLHVPFEIIVGDDASTDGTEEIVRTYAERHPTLIRPVLRTENAGPGRNLADIIERATGKYVALLEGDDFWNDPEKLLFQYAFLESHPEHAICFHPVYEMVEDKQGAVARPSDHRTEWSFDDLARVNFIATCSSFFRNGLFGRFPDWYFARDLGMWDWPLHLLNARHGGIGLVNRCMATYRTHPSGIWSGSTQEARLLKKLRVCRLLREWFAEQGPEAFTAHIAALEVELARAIVRTRPREAADHLVRELVASPRAMVTELLAQARTAFRIK